MSINYKNLFGLDDLSLESIIKYNKNSRKLIEYNKKEINTLIKEINMELKELYKRYPHINIIRKNLKRKNKKYVISKNYSIGNLVSFGANIDDKPNSFELILMPYKDIKNKLAKIRFRYYPRNKRMKANFSRLSVALKSSKVEHKKEIITINNKKYIEFSVLNEQHNSKFWYTVKLWAKN